MCGIIFGRRNDNKPIFKNLFKRYLEQSHRGDEGFGYIAIKNGKVMGVKRFKDQDEVEKALKKEDASEILFHHRFPTSTPNFPDLNHPIVVKNKKLEHNYYVVHNGVIKNPETLRTKHEQEGYKYTTIYEKYEVEKTKNMSSEKLVEELFNDSEALAIDLARYFEGHQNTIDSVGSIAFIAIQTDKQNNIKNIFYGRNTGNPLIVESFDDRFIFIKSEGKGDKIDDDIIYVEDYKTHNLTQIDVQVGKLNHTYTPYPSTTVVNGYTGYNTRGWEDDEEDYVVVKSLSELEKGGFGKTKKPFDYDDDTEYLDKHITPQYQKALQGIGSDTDEFDEDEYDYACCRLDEVESELSALYKDQEKIQDLIAEYQSFIDAGKMFDEGLYHTSLIEKAKEEKTLESINDKVQELELELIELCDYTGIESSVVDFVDDKPELQVYKDAE